MTTLLYCLFPCYKCLVRKFCQSFLGNLYTKTLENIYKLLFCFLKMESCEVSVGNCIWSFQLALPKGEIYFFGRMIWKVWCSTVLQSGSWLCKDAAEFGTSPPHGGNCAWSGVLKGREERLHLPPSTTPVGKTYCRATERSTTICCSSGENWPGPSNYYLQLDYSQLE